MTKRISDEIASEKIKKAKSNAKNNFDKTGEELVDAEAEKFLLLFDKTFSEHYEKKLNNENDANLDCEDGVADDILTKIAKKQKNKTKQRKHSLK